MEIMGANGYKPIDLICVRHFKKLLLVSQGEEESLEMIPSLGGGPADFKRTGEGMFP